MRQAVLGPLGWRHSFRRLNGYGFEGAMTIWFSEDLLITDYWITEKGMILVDHNVFTQNIAITSLCCRSRPCPQGTKQERAYRTMTAWAPLP